MVDCMPPPARLTLKWITVERIALYRQVQTPGESILLSVELFPVEDFVPTEDNIKWAVRRLRNNCSGGPSVMREDHIKL